MGLIKINIDMDGMKNAAQLAQATGNTSDIYSFYLGAQGNTPSDDRQQKVSLVNLAAGALQWFSDLQKNPATKNLLDTVGLGAKIADVALKWDSTLQNLAKDTANALPTEPYFISETSNNLLLDALASSTSLLADLGDKAASLFAPGTPLAASMKSVALTLSITASVISIATNAANDAYKKVCADIDLQFKNAGLLNQSADAMFASLRTKHYAENDWMSLQPAVVMLLNKMQSTTQYSARDILLMINCSADSSEWHSTAGVPAVRVDNVSKEVLALMNSLLRLYKQPEVTVIGDGYKVASQAAVTAVDKAIGNKPIAIRSVTELTAQEWQEWMDGTKASDPNRFAYRYALIHGNAFAITEGIDYKDLNQHGELELYENGGQITDAYLDARITYMLDLMKAYGSENMNPEQKDKVGMWSPVDSAFQDLAQDASIDLGGNPHIYSFTTFGTDGNDTFNDSDQPRAMMYSAFGGAGDDTFIVGEGNHYLEGGQGHDLYTVNGKGTHTIFDTDADGSLYFANSGHSVGYLEQSKITPGQVWESVNPVTKEPDGWITATRRGLDLLVTNHELAADVVIKDFFAQLRPDADGTLIGYGIGLRDFCPPAPAIADQPEQTGPGSNIIMGDLAPKDTNDQLPGIQIGYDQYGNLIGEGAQPDRNDTLYDTPNNDAIYGKGGNDYIYGGRGGNDYLDGGAGDDYIRAGSGNDTLIGGTGNDRLCGGAGNDYLDGGDGEDELYGEAGNDVLHGGKHNDKLWGGAGNDFLYGDEGEDTLDGGDGDDVLYGGKGNDELIGGAGKDTFVFAVGDGIDTIKDGEDGDVVWFDGIASKQLAAILRVDRDLVLRYGTDDQVTIKDYFANLSESPKILFKFTDTVWSVADIKARAVMYGSGEDDWLTGYAGGTNRIYGLDGNDTIYGDDFDDELYGGRGENTLYGRAGDDRLIGGDDADHLYGGDGRDLLVGGKGDDYLDGGQGGDIYRIARGDGKDTIMDKDDTPAEIDTVEFVDLRPADITAVLRTHGGSDLVLQYGNGDQLTIKNYFWQIGGVDHDADGYSDTYKIERFKFVDGTVWTEAEIRNLMITIGDENTADYLSAYGNQDNRMYGLSGDDGLSGGDGNDLLDGGEGNDSLIGGAGDDILIGGDGNDSLSGGDGDDVLIGGKDNDLLLGGDGNDTYRFSKGDGVDKILDVGYRVDVTAKGEVEFTYYQDTIEFTDVLASEVSLFRDGDDLLIRYGAGDELRVQFYFLYAGDDPSYESHQFPITSKIQFSDGAVWGAEQVVAHVQPIGAAQGNGFAEDRPNHRIGQEGDDFLFGGMFDDVLEGRAGADYLSGQAGRDRLIGGKGDDQLSGGTGIDTYVFSKGDGADLIRSDHVGSRTISEDIVEFTDIKSTDIRAVQRSDDDLIILYGDSDELTIADYFAEIAFANGFYQSDKVGLFKFSDGVEWRETDILARAQIISDEPDSGDPEPGYSVIWGTPGNDVLTGGAGDQTIYGGAGNDILTSITGWDELYGEDGDDTLYGGDTWTLLNGGAGNDLLYGGTGTDQFEFDLEDLTAATIDQIFNASDSDYIRIGDLWLDELVYTSTGTGQWQSEDGGIQLQLNGADLTIRCRGEDGSLLPASIVVKDYSEGILALTLPDYPAGGVTENQAPTTGLSLSDQTIAQNALFSLVLPQGLFSDPDGDVLTYSVALANGAALPAWLTFDPATRTLSGTPGNTEVGNLSFRVTATDPDSLSAAQTFSLTVTNVNDAPEAVGTLSPQSVRQNEAWQFIIPQNAFRDIDGDALAYSVTLADGSALPSWLHFDAQARTVSGTPGNAEVGNLSFKVTATDPGGLSASQTFGLTVTNINDAPQAVGTLSTQSATQDETWRFVIPQDAFRDIDGDTLVYSVSLSDGSSLPAWITFDALTRTLSGTPGNAEVGSLTFKVTATDPAGLSASLNFALNINNVNDAPIAVGELGEQHGQSGQPWQYIIPESAFRDIDGDTLVYTVVLHDGSALPAWLHFDAGTRTLSGTPGTTDNGTLSLRIMAADPSGLTAAQALQVNIQALNHAPQTGEALTAQTTSQNQAWRYVIPKNAFADVDGDALTYRVTLADGSALPSWLTFDVTTRTLFGTPNDATELAFRITATDPGGLSTSQSLSLNIQGINPHAPVYYPGWENWRANRNQFFYCSPMHDFYDPDGGLLSYTITQEDGSPLPSWLNIVEDMWMPGSFSIQGTPTSADAGQARIKVVATDEEGLSTAHVYSLPVTDLNNAPQRYAQPSAQRATEYQPFSITLPSNMFVDPDGDSFTQQITLADGSPLPGWLHYNAANGTLSGVANARGESIQLRVTATDTYGASGEQTFWLQIQSDPSRHAGENIILINGNSSYNSNGTAGNDRVESTNNITYYGNGGNDTIITASGIIDGGDGDDYIYTTDGGILSGGNGDDYIESFGSGIFLGDAGNDRIYFQGGIAKGGSGDDYIESRGDSGMLDGEAGNDLLVGSNTSCNETYLFYRGGDHDRIRDAGGSDDYLMFGPGIDNNQLWFSREGQDLRIDCIGSNDSMTIEGWYSDNGQHQIEHIMAGDKSLVLAQVDRLVQAMAAFSPPAPGQTVLPDAYQAALSPILASSWQ